MGSDFWRWNESGNLKELQNGFIFLKLKRGKKLKELLNGSIFLTLKRVKKLKRSSECVQISDVEKVENLKEFSDGVQISDAEMSQQTWKNFWMRLYFWNWNVSNSLKEVLSGSRFLTLKRVKNLKELSEWAHIFDAEGYSKKN